MANLLEHSFLVAHAVGDTGVVDGVTYTAVDRASLITKIAAGQASECCTSLVTDMKGMFEDAISFNKNNATWYNFD